MPANEIENRLAAAGWIGFETGADGFLLSLRSQVSCQARLITTPVVAAIGQDFAACPIIIVPLDRELSRRETQIVVTTLNTEDQLERLTYPWTFGTGYDEAQATPDPRIVVQPLHLDWIGDLTNPTWVPYGLGGTSGTPVPDGFDLDIYNAVAFFMTSDTGVPIQQDFSFVIFQSPPVEGVTLVQDVLFVEEEA